MNAFSDKRNKIFLLVATAIFMSTLDSSIVNVALPYIMKDFQAPIESIQWVVIIYLLTVSSLLLAFGRLSDIRGRRVIYCSGFAVFSIGSLLCSLAWTPTFLIISRAIQGVGAAMLMACSPALIVDVFPPKKRGKALGLIGAVVAAGLTAGPVAGGLILDYFSWRFIFYINLPIGMAAMLAGAILLKNTPADQGSREPLDMTGSILLIITLISLITLMTHLSVWEVFSVPFGTAVLLFAGAGIGFVITELKTAYPVFDMTLLQKRIFVFPVISAMILFASLFIIIFMMPFFLVHACEFSASVTGFIMTAPFIFLLIVSPVSGAMYDKMGSKPLCAAGMCIVISSLLFLMFLSPDMSGVSIAWRLSLTGIGTAMFTSPNNTAVMNSVSPERRGIASGTVATSRNLGMLIGVSVAGLIFSTSFSRLTGGAGLENYHPDMTSYFMVTFKRVMAAGVVLSVINFGLVFLRGKEPRGTGF